MPKTVTLPADSIPWDIQPVPKRVVAVGDVHGDLEALAAILLTRNLIDNQGHWQGQNTHLVLNGDLIGDHPDARLLVDFILRLETEAPTQQGMVHALLGNHDIQLHYRKTAAPLFEKYPVPQTQSTRYTDAFRGNTPYAQWLRERNAIIKIGNTLFVHAGLNTWALDHDPGQINATIRAWIRYWQGVDKKPDRASGWTVGQEGFRQKLPYRVGPIWTRAFKPQVDKKDRYVEKPQPGAPTSKEFKKILKKYNTQRMIIGHSPLPGQEVLLSHPVYGKRVVLIDTRISAEGGRLSCIELSDGILTDHYTERSEAALHIRDTELFHLENDIQPLSQLTPVNIFERFRHAAERFYTSKIKTLFR